MTRRADPVRTAAAQREGRLRRLMDTGLSRESAGLWERAWYAEAVGLGLSESDWDSWERGLAWIAEQRSARNGSGSA